MSRVRWTGASMPLLAVSICMGWLSPAANALVTPGAPLVEVHSNARFFEGPTWDPYTARLYFSSLTGAGQLFRLEPPNTVALWMDNTQSINGTYLSNDRRLLCAQGNAKQILSMRIGLNGPEDPQVVASNAAWNAPNDLCQAPSGNIYFTTPNFGGGGGSYVYRIAPGGAVTAVVTDMTIPNGVVASNDGSTLYVGDSNKKWWRSYPILPDGSVGPGALFFNPSTSNQNDPDGMTIDEFGNLYFCGRGGVWMVSPQGQQLEFVSVPVFNTNVEFGGVDGRTLYITGDGKVYSLAMDVRGAAWRDVPANNQPPQVDAGPELLIMSRTNTGQVTATVSDDGLPTPPGAVSVNWYKMSGPGDVTFSPPNAASTTATFSTFGAYVLRAMAFDGIRSAFDQVTITVASMADFDHDGDVDANDYGYFQVCMTGAGQGPPGQGCALTDLDTDSDVDQSDFGILQRCFSGPGQPSDPHCAD